MPLLVAAVAAVLVTRQTAAAATAAHVCARDAFLREIYRAN